MNVTSPLDRLCGPGGLLSPEPADLAEFEGLKSSGLVRLRDARSAELALESRFDLAYNAAHALSLAALRRCGYRTDKRFAVFQVLPHTLGLEREVWLVLDKAHRVRNASEYEGAMALGERLIEDLIDAAEAVAEALSALDPPS